jgi:hypothetical protein
VIFRIAGIIVVLAVAYFVVPWIVPFLPPIHINKVEPPQPTTLRDVIKLYLTHTPSDQIEMVQSPYDADWDTNSNDVYQFYNLTGLVPTTGDLYSSSGYEIESNYESFLLTLRPGVDPRYEQLLDAYKRARSAATAPGRTKAKVQRKKQNDKALQAMVTYLENDHAGPTAPRLGKALMDYYSGREAGITVKFPSGNDKRLQWVETSPDISQIHQNSKTIPMVDFIVPSITTAPGNPTVQTVQAQSLKIVELTITRRWLDIDLLKEARRQNGPWNGAPPAFFGPSGTLARIPIRLVLIEKPTIETSSVVRDANASGQVTVGPFSYSAAEIKTDGKVLQLTPSRQEWVVLAVVSEEL